VRVFIQVNTSNEDSKNGLHTIEELLTLAQHITLKCPNLILIGLMTIGSPADDPKKDFQVKIFSSFELETFGFRNGFRKESGEIYGIKHGNVWRL
jgi:uncharacterized pyridoxal phosphate-containing UPF0001 family protein